MLSIRYDSQLNYEKIKKGPQRLTKIKPFIKKS